MSAAMAGPAALALLVALAPAVAAGEPPCNPFCGLVDLDPEGNCVATIVVCLGGNGEGDLLAASTDGNSQSGLVALSQEGNAEAGLLAVSWSGNAQGPVAVSVCGDAEGLVAVGLGLEGAAPALCPET